MARKVRFGHYLAYGSNDFLGAGAMSDHRASGSCSSTPRSVGSTPTPSDDHLTARLSQPSLDAFFSRRSSATSPTASINNGLGKKFGRRRFFILLAVPLLPSFALMWVDGQSFWYYLMHLLLLRARVRDGDSSRTKRWPRRCRLDYRTKAKFAGARIICCGQIAATIAAVVAAGSDHRAAGGKESAAHLPLSRRDLLRVLHVRRARRCSCSPGNGRARRSRSIVTDEWTSPLACISLKLYRRTLGDDAHPRVPPAPRHVSSAATSARTS